MMPSAIGNNLLNRQLNTQGRHAGLDPASSLKVTGFRLSPE
jgi:hypothetical protein